MIVRHATTDDADAIERVRTDTWRATYRGLMPDALLDRLEPAPSRRRDHLARLPADQFTLVAEDGGTVVGFCAGGPSRSDSDRFPGEVYAIYIVTTHHRRGAGRAMLAQAAAELVGRGWRAMIIWVLRENAPARAFYERMGGRFVRDEEREVDGVRITESGYGWEDVEPLASAAAVQGPRSRSFGGSGDSTQRM